MALAQVTYTVPDPPTQDYAVSFPFLRDANLVVEVDGSTTGVTFTIASTKDEITVVTPTLLVDQLVTIKRVTPVTNAGQYVSFSDASTLRKDDLETARKQLLYALQEITDAGTTGLQLDLADTKWDAESRVIKNVSDPVNAQDAATKAYVTTALATAGELPDPSTGDPLDVLRVNSGGTAYELAGVTTETHLLRIKSQPSGPAGYANGWVLPAFSSGFTDSSQRCPLETVTSINGTAAVSLAANTFDLTLGAGKWVIRAVGHLRGLTDTGAVNSTSGQLAITNTSGSASATGPEVTTGYAVQVQDSGAVITKTGQMSATCEVNYFVDLAVATTYNLRGRGSTSSHSVVADFPSYLVLTKLNA